jgi:mannose-6-phosphate isomerase-like protein (cupin superfamily)
MQNKLNVSSNFYDDKVVLKPWGYEYTLFRISSHCRVVFVHIKYKKKTSLHCHPSKNTGFIILEGNTKVQLGIYKKNVKIFKPLKRLVLRKGLYHSLEAKTKEGLYALEFEFPANESDLLRFEDYYGREKKDYEGKNFTKKNNFFRFKKFESKNQSFKFKNKIIEILRIKSKRDFKKISDKALICVLKGTLVNQKNIVGLRYGEIMLGKTLLVFLKKFKLQKNQSFIIMSVKKFSKI